MVRDVSNRDRNGRIGVRAGAGEGEQIVFYDVPEGAAIEFRRAIAESARAVVRVEGPSGSAQTFPLQETAPSHYEAHIFAQQPGMYRVLFPGAKGEEPETAFYRDLVESTPKLVNKALMTQISEITGGTVDPDVSRLLDPEGSFFFEPYALWPVLLLLALILDFMELAIRKGAFSFPVHFPWTGGATGRARDRVFRFAEASVRRPRSR
jgi:hypothetical protein